LQSKRDKKFQQYDFGKKENQKRYGQNSPPEINISTFDTPVAMFVGKQDPLSSPAVGQWTNSQVKNTVYYKDLDNWDHSSFSVGKDMSYFEDVLSLMSKYNPV
jgi:hypothetical protein